MTDLHVTNHGSIFALAAVTEAGRDWIADNISADAMTWGGSIVVEHRYIDAIIDGAVNDGLEVS